MVNSDYVTLVCGHTVDKLDNLLSTIK